MLKIDYRNILTKSENIVINKNKNKEFKITYFEIINMNSKLFISAKNN